MNLDLFCLDKYIINFFRDFSSQQFLVSTIGLWLVTTLVTSTKKEKCKK